jgi:hypothetical protein
VFVHGALHLTSSNNPRLDEPEVFDPAKCAKLTAECARLQGGDGCTILCASLTCVPEVGVFWALQ